MIAKRRKAQLLAVCTILIGSLFSLGLNMLVDKAVFSVNGTAAGDSMSKHTTDTGSIQTVVSKHEIKETELPIIMYHSVLKSPKKKTPYVIPPELLEEDLKSIKKAGYTPVFMKDVINFVLNTGDLPENPIVLTFDDGYYNNLYYADPLLKKYDMKAVLSIVGEMTEEFSYDPDRNPNYSHVTWDDIFTMHMSGRWEMQNHSYSCHTYEKRNGVSQMDNESYDDYEDFLMADLCHLQDKLAYVTGVTPSTFTYPFGAFSENTDKVLKKIGFKATLSCTEGVSTIKKGDPECLYKLKRHLRPPDKSSEEFFSFLQ
ncbi:MAG: polysaccharide deacetylase family protein [Firmicutes bacterium]|nr:polysaccharide deacetylase family protein [Bacillota bacterium]